MRPAALRMLAAALPLVAAACPVTLPPGGPPEPAFPFPATQGGLAGQVLVVANLDAEGPGSLRAALGTQGPRVIVFEVGGVVDLAAGTLTVDEPYVTVAGQTAPSPGITVIRGNVLVRTHDVLIQHVRVRPGDAGQPRGWEPDGVTCYGAGAHNVVIEHCSITWAVDENLSASGPQHEGREGTTHHLAFTNNIVAEGLDKSTHSEGRHSKGSLIYDHVTEVAVVGNLYAHNDDRNPYFKADATGVVVNNLIYNPGEVAISLDYDPEEYEGFADEPRPARVSIVGNVLLFGPDTPFYLAMVTGLGEVYLSDNAATRRNGRPAPLLRAGLQVSDVMPIWVEGLDPMPSAQVRDWVLRYAGARPWDRDVVDARIIQTVRDGSGGIIDGQDEVGGYPEPEPTHRPLVIPNDNIQLWLDSFIEEPSD